MTALDREAEARIRAAHCDESPTSVAAHLAMVAEIMERKAVQRTCQPCGQDFVDGYCDVCSATQKHVEDAPHRAAEPRSKVCKCVSCRCEKGEGA